MHWNLRFPNTELVLEEVYDGHPNLFSLKIHYGGVFRNFPGRRYAYGRFRFVDFLDILEFSDQVNSVVEKLGLRQLKQKLYFHFKIPRKNLDVGLAALDVNHLGKYVKDNKVIELYIEHGSTKITTYFNSSQSTKVVIEELEDVFPELTRPLGTKKMASGRLLLNWKEPGDEYVNQGGDGCYTNVGDDHEDSDDSDYIVDKDNEVDNVEVDMRGYVAFIDSGEEFVGRITHDSREESNQDDDVNDQDCYPMDYESFDSLPEDSDDDFESKRSRKLKELRSKRKQQNPTAEVTFYVGKIFGNAKDVKVRVRRHAIETRRELVLLINESRRIRAICHGNVSTYEEGDKVTSEDKLKKKFGDCPWVLYITRLTTKDETWIVKTYKAKHTCLQSRFIKVFTSSFMAQESLVLNQLESNPNISTKIIQDELERKFELGVSKHKAFRAKAKGSRIIRGDYKEQYSKLRDYILEVNRTNPDSTFKFVVEPETNPDSPTRVFKRVYVCLGALKKGFKACRRELLGSDGAFMKGPYRGQMLTVVGIDPNNGIYPVAYAIVEAENKSSWIWFLQCLQDDLDLDIRSDFTFISDRQKGIIPAVSTMFPSAQHRFCLRHIHENMKLQWRGKGFKDILWNCATSTTLPEFEAKMEELKMYNVNAYNWLKKIPPQHWIKSHFTRNFLSRTLIINFLA